MWELVEEVGSSSRESHIVSKHIVYQYRLSMFIYHLHGTKLYSLHTGSTCRGGRALPLPDKCTFEI